MSDKPSIDLIKDWIPVKLKNNGLFEWLYLGEKRFTEPFFDETIAKCRSLESNSKPVRLSSDFDSLIFQADQVESIAPAAMIFHVSRCGSTLLSQLLSIDEQFISLAEVPLFDDILRSHFKNPSLDYADQQNALKAAIKLMGKKRSMNERSLIVKVDSWHLFFYDTYRKLFPSIPFILLYRSPDEVIRSHQQLRGMQAVPGVIEPEVFGFKPDEVNYTNLDAYLCDVLIRYQQQLHLLIQTDASAHLFNYSEGPLNMMQRVFQLTKQSVSDKVWDEIVQRSSYHSKHPDKKFTEERTEELNIPNLKTAMKLYRELEEIRLSTISS
ncbi:sulfotransferase family protein [Solitalea longa]|uniref:Sulfotransferase family protein n=1 Tax=Solitalea longa TaxID=2079460 RepID=A0A2S4ZZ89_9SPHI|nr:sulfotransferase family protein [Solitalea longa]POY35675.1 sulfotransferase family protein [Solitalea longa]